ncbi:MAG: hypothetical protein AAFP98_06115, partial [Pseudomonadota bacterium]
MPKFLLAYHGTPDLQGNDAGAAHMAAWKAWNEGLGAAVVDPGMPVGKSITVSATDVIDNGGSNPLSGITILQADTLDEVIKMAQTCPHL